MRTSRSAALAASLFFLLGVLSAPADAAAKPAPRLLVLVVVDQMRADFYEKYGAAWTGGLKRLYEQGAWFANARYPYLSTVTCPGHATIGTGAYPRTHGMILNMWYDRERGKAIDCTDDPATPLLSYRVDKVEGDDSAKNLMAPTLGDELKAQLKPAPRVVGFSLKARSAVNITGHAPDLALWFAGKTWVTSAAFTTSRLSWVEKFLEKNPIEKDLETPWTRILPDDKYLHDDESAGERPPRGWDRQFPHELKSSRPDASSIGRWETSPLPDAYMAKMAQAALREMKLGKRRTPDLLAVSFSMVDIIGHQFGPRSHEVQDTLARLDRALGELLAALDRHMGRGNYVLALTADHGVAVVPEQLTADGEDAGRILGNEIKKRANEAIAAELGAGEHVVSVQQNDVYLAPGVHARLLAKPEAMRRVLTAIRGAPGVGHAFDSSELRDAAAASDPVQKAAALSYYPGRSGDIMISPRKNWITGSGIAANHGTVHDYDQHVPVIFFGKSIKPGRYEREVSPADIAPSLARMVGVRMHKAEGTPLTEIIADEPVARQARKVAAPRASR